MLLDTVKSLNVTLFFLLAEVDNRCKGLQPWQLILYTFITTLVILKTKLFLFKRDISLMQRCKKFAFRWIRRLPIIGTMIRKKIEKVESVICADKLFRLRPKMDYRRQLPRLGLSDAEIMTEIDENLCLDHKWQDGSVSGAVYYGETGLTDAMGQVFKKFVWSNPLHADIFPAVRKLEAEVVRMVCHLFHGDPVKSCGCITSGGTESILLAVKAYRDWAHDNGVEYPEIVCPVSVHAAFEKAAHYFKVKLVQVPLDCRTWKVDLKKMKQAINKNTCMIAVSAPQFPHGIIDPIPEVAALGKRYGVPVHVDACLGGFLIAFMDDAGYPLEAFDFRLPGVTSISVDTHKYGFAPKGTSCIMYSSPKWRRYQYFVAPNWQGGMYATATLGGSRTGTVVAACWASMVRFGYVGYVNCTRKILSTQRYITEELRKINFIYVFGKPEVSVVAIGSLDFDIFLLSSALVKVGWNLNALQFPSAIHLCCTMLHTQPDVADRFTRDVKRCVDEIMMNPRQKNTGSAAMYGMAQTIPDRSLVSELASAYLDAVYDTPRPRASGAKTNGVH